MPKLFEQGDLRDYLRDKLRRAVGKIESIDEDEFLLRSDDSLTEEALNEALCQPLVVREDSYVGGNVSEVEIDVTGDFRYDRFPGNRTIVKGSRVRAEYPYEGNRDLFQHRPSRFKMTDVMGDVHEGIVAVTSEAPGMNHSPDNVKRWLAERIGLIAEMARFATADVEKYNAEIEAPIRKAIAGRRNRLLERRNLTGALGFPLERRDDAPHRVPIDRKVLGVKRHASTKPLAERKYQDEYAITEADYEDVVGVITGVLRACERSPSIITDKSEETLRDHLILQLNGTFKGVVTGETFVTSGKTDILVRIEDRHVFVGECKWWDGPKAFDEAIDQLLSYMPWRDEKAALVLFIDRRNATAVIDAADQVVQKHASFKRLGMTSSDPAARRNYVLSHPDDPEREIKVALLFAVIRNASDEGSEQPVEG